MNHDELVKKASSWLSNTKRCSIVITEMGSSTSEIPDAIGWNGSHSTLVECKVSVTDFKNDHRKPARRHSRFCMGNNRYYMVPADLVDFAIAIENSPEGWGVIKAVRNSCRVIIQSDNFPEVAKDREILLLISSIRRIAMTRQPLTGMNVRCYTFGKTNDNDVRATLGINLDKMPGE